MKEIAKNYLILTYFAENGKAVSSNSNFLYCLINKILEATSIKFIYGELLIHGHGKAKHD